MATTGNVPEILKELSKLDLTTLDELIDVIYNRLNLSIAIFDSENILQGINMKVDRCKCYYMLLHKKPNQCSIFDPDFVEKALSVKEVDQLCTYCCRLTSREAIICGTLHKIIIFQYNLDDDSLEFNPKNDPSFVPLCKGDSTAVDYF